jgi:hypothetical protein
MIRVSAPAVWIAAAALLASGEEAAAVTVTNVAIGIDGGARMTRPAAAEYWVSYQDCLDDTALVFTVSTTSPISVGASASYDCLDPTTVASSLPIDNCYAIASNVGDKATVTVSTQELVHGTLGIATSGPARCKPSSAPAGESMVWPQAITFYFYVPVSGGAATDYEKWPPSPLTMAIALEGPAPPSPVGLQAGDQELTLSLPSAPADARTVGYYAFCFPYIGAGGTGGSTTTTTTAGMNDCTGNPSIPGLDPTQPDVGSPYVCGVMIPPDAGSFPIQSLSPMGDPLTNGTQYVVGRGRLRRGR